jgi:hypothetical protein
MKPTGTHREELVEELLLKERAITKAREKLKADTKLQREKIGALEGRRDELLDLLEGREHVEPELPLVSPGKGGKKAEPPALKWKAAGANEVATTPAGTYCVEPNQASGEFSVYFTPPGGRSKKLGAAAVLGDAFDVARRHQLEGGADAILENAGDGKLTAKGRRKLKAVEDRP